MTPPAASTAAGAATGHRRRLDRSPSSRAPRRVSGPARTPKGRGPSASKATARVDARQLTFADQLRGGAIALPLPGRRTRTKTRRGTRSTAGEPLAVRVGLRLGALSQSRLLGRLTAGRVWIGLIAILLIGLVYFQVALLKLNAQMGADVQRSAKLQTAISATNADINKLATLERFQDAAAGLGMFLPASGSVTFLGPDGKNVGGDVAPAPTAADATIAQLPTMPENPGLSDTAPDPSAATTGIDPTTGAAIDPATGAPVSTTTPDPAATAPVAPVTTTPDPTAVAAGATTPAPTATDPAATATTPPPTTAAPATTGGATVTP